METETTSASDPAASAPAQPVAQGDSAVVLVGRNTTLSQLAGNEWSPVDLKSLPDTIPNACLGGATAFFDTEGVPWVSCGAYVFTRQADNTWGLVEDQRGRAFFDPKGRIWLNTGKTISVRENGEWTAFEAQKAINEEFFPNEAAAFSPDGVAYFAGPSTGVKLVSFDGATWKNYGRELGDNVGNPQSLLYTSKGELLVGTSRGVYKLVGDKLEAYISSQQIGEALGETIEYSSEIRDLVETPDGTIWLATKGGVLAWNGSQLNDSGVAEGLPAFETNDLAVDANGNVWAATVHGVAVRTGEKWQAAVPSTSNISDGFIYAIAVKGTPTLPAPGEEKTTTITGRVIEDSKPLANTEVELCSETPGFFKYREQVESPCGNQFFHTIVKTDDKGIFRFENAPTGAYTLAVKDKEGHWASFIGLDVIALEPNSEVVKDIEL
jgi:ligand-binding sensor domain-containing protein